MGLKVSTKKLNLDDNNLSESKKDATQTETSQTSCSDTARIFPQEVKLPPTPVVNFERNKLGRNPILFDNFSNMQARSRMPALKEEFDRLYFDTERYLQFTNEYFIRDCEAVCQLHKEALTVCLNHSRDRPLLCKEEVSHFLSCLRNCEPAQQNDNQMNTFNFDKD